MASKHLKTTADIRESFQKYFKKNGHTRVESSSLVPQKDPTLLFTNAGMNQFKDTFLGVEKRPYTRATSAQKVVRAGGKHNDLENVGFTARHHTFFEMLGNFSFGDYFKKDAIHFAWEFVTKELGLPKDKLRVSVFEKDDESAEIWHKQEGLPLDRIVRFGEADNFWQMGDTGPCGPCSEIFWDQGRKVDGDRWLEFWNCVFMQYNRSSDGKLNPLPAPSVDTGMGLERIAAILQGVGSNYEIDLMHQLVLATQDLASSKAKRKITYDPALAAGSGFSESAALRVIVDHLRSTSFLIADGVLPSNEGRGYVLRRILRRAVRYAKRLGVEEPLLCDLYPSLESAMGGAYPELKARRSVVTEILREEESRFYETLNVGLELLEDSFGKLNGKTTLPAEVVFKLYDTFGFPADLTALIAREKNLAIDEAGFDRLMGEQQQKSRASWKGSGETAILNDVKEWKDRGIAPKFTGYDTFLSRSKVVAVSKGEKGAWIAIDPCPFYGEGGGQVGDRGTLELSGGKKLNVTDTIKPYEGGIALYVDSFPPELKVGAEVQAQVNESLRRATHANHTATHLLHAALRKFLGTHVAQAGSLVNEQKLRFDFSHNKALTPDEIEKIETWVNDTIEKDIPLGVEVTSYKSAIEKGAMALFGEKYGDQVRVVAVPGFSTELCGGTHVSRTGEIKQFKILSESAVAAGTRRIEAITGRGVIQWYEAQEQKLRQVSDLLKAGPDAVVGRIERLMDRQRELENEIKKLQQQLVSGASASDENLKGKYRDLPLLVHVLGNADANLLRQKGDAVRKTNPDAIHVVVAGELLLVTLDPQKLKGQHAGNILKALSTSLGGRGGGQAQTAQGQISVTQPEKILEWASSQN